jgi:hypothetical protein
MKRHQGRIVIDAVVPDYYARFPKPCVGGWGRRSLNVTPAGKVLPMIKVGVLYPSDKGTKFDIDYYCKKHMPMVQQKLGAVCKKIAVDYGLEGGAPGSKPGFAAAGHLYCEFG